MYVNMYKSIYLQLTAGICKIMNILSFGKKSQISIVRV